MKEKLIGFLLGALDNEDVVHVEQLLETNDDAREQLEILRLGMVPLEADREHVEAPPDLVMRTCQFVRQLPRPHESRA